jgi:NAD(P)-dependent dehydrogenase (short-subunit alcohol dehydrogenase family)
VTPRVWLVTGASSGFGRAIAEAALAAGDVVVGAARRPEALADLVEAHPGRVDAIRLDVTSPDAPAVVDDVVARHGRIDVLVNNAGRTQVGALEETTEDELRYLFELHFFGPALLTRAALPHLRRQGGGAVVQMSSVGGQITGPGFGVLRHQVRSGGADPGAARRGRRAGALPDRGAGLVPHRAVRPWRGSPVDADARVRGHGRADARVRHRR